MVAMRVMATEWFLVLGSWWLVLEVQGARFWAWKGFLTGGAAGSARRGEMAILLALSTEAFGGNGALRLPPLRDGLPSLVWSERGAET